MIRQNSRAGFTMIEVAISSVLLALLALVSLSMLGAAQKGYAESRVRTYLQDKTRIVLKEIARELANTSVECPSWSLTKDSVTFEQIAGFDFVARDRTWATIKRIRLDGDALVFEDLNSSAGVVRSRTLAQPVSDFSLDAGTSGIDLVEVEIEMEGLDSQGVVISVTNQVTVFLRN